MTTEQPPIPYTDRRATGLALPGLLWCAGCEQALRPVRVLGEPTMYDCRSGCRGTPLDASTVEHLVLTAVERHEPSLVARVGLDCRASLCPQVIVRVVVGATPDDLTITWRV